ncbi:type IX secretion system anionic LPS delivery protein PorZ [Pseudofulvibacter geojedonensis]|uniref:Two-component regulator propeller domain-containing protein n=1 Tax=Pseudofulvibacter geojedonensis TaxID=1123758 RepID=A0ABW3I3V1_9FLAO
MQQKILFFLLSLSFLFNFSQDYSGQWDGHFAYLNISGVGITENGIIASAENAIFNYNISNQNTITTSTINGLSGESISSFYYSETYKSSVVGYDNGLLEIVSEENEVTTVVDILNKTNIPPDMKKINHIYENNGLVYLSCDFGISVYDLSNLEFGDTYYIGNSGEQIVVNQTTILNDYIYAATASNGIKRALYANSNIIDFNLWTNVTGLPTNNWESIVNLDSTLYGITSTNDLYDITNNNTLISYPNAILDHRVSNNNMLVTSNINVYVYNNSASLVNTIAFLPEHGSNYTCATIKDNNIYIGTQFHGVLDITLNNGNLNTIIQPNGPLENNQFAVQAANNEVWVVYGDHNLSFNPYPLDQKGISHLINDNWVNTPYADIFETRSIVDIAINPFNKNQVFLSSFYSGLLEINNNTPTILYDNSNSGLKSLCEVFGCNYADIRVGRSAFDTDGKLWMTNNLTFQPLKVYDVPNNSWTAYNLSPVVSSSTPQNDNDGFADLVIDQNNTKWIATHEKGVIGFNDDFGSGTAKNVNLSTGNLPSDKVTALSIDKDNNLWIGTLQGLRVLYNTANFFNTANPQAQQIIILDDGIPKELMFGQYITDIETDGSNNKWIATFDAGVFYVSSDGQETIYHFTKDNSPLPTNNITDMSIDKTSGKVYLSTPKGLVAFKGLSKEPASDLDNVVIYPNPVRPNHVRSLLGYNATDISKGIKIEGLTENINLKITDISGNLVAEANTSTKSGNVSISEGGFAIWNGKNFNNSIVASGVYVIMITDLDTSNTTLEKVMIIK